MTNPAGSRELLIRVLVELAREAPPGTLNSLISALEVDGDGQDLGRLAATQTMRERLRRLDELRDEHPEIDGPAIGLALRTASEAAAAVMAEYHTEIAWTGPATDSVPLRRVDQVMYSMIDSSKEDVLLVSYAAYRPNRLLRALQAASERGVGIRLVLELADESGGKISFDGLDAVRAAVPSAQVFYWPNDERPRSTSGEYGAMHAKCLLVDGQMALVSSANLTEHALELNMELGVVLGRSDASRLSRHFAELVSRGRLVPLMNQ
jgi:phosphatidylserine/phosphatidylglycerophosphate/cardiolipin synthase-like enzyme